MSNPEYEPAPDNYTEVLEGLLAQLQKDTEIIRSRETSRIRTYGQLDEVLKKYGVTEETRFLRAAFKQNPTDRQKTRNFLEYIRSLDEEVSASAGQMAMWVTSKDEIMSHPFNPAVRPQTQKEYRLFMGLLPDQASIEVGRLGDITIPIAKSVSGPIVGVYMSGQDTDQISTYEQLSAFEEVIPANVFDGKWGRFQESTKIDLSYWNFENPIPAIFGDQKVKEFFTSHELEKHQEITDSLDVLTATLF